ncbi:MAG: hypothetical protein AB8G05_13550 [Oligoflexales bacterium]
MNRALFILFQSLLCLVQGTQVLASDSSSDLDNALQQEIIELVLQSGENSEKLIDDDFYFLEWSYSDSLYLSATGSLDAHYFWNSNKVGKSGFIKYLTDEITYEFYRGRIARLSAEEKIPSLRKADLV